MPTAPPSPKETCDSHVVLIITIDPTDEPISSYHSTYDHYQKRKLTEQNIYIVSHISDKHFGL